MFLNDFDTHGYLVTAALFDESACQIWQSNLDTMPIAMAGNRNLLASDWCATLAHELKNHPLLAQVLPQSLVAVQCTLFEKSLDRNWLVALHQDLSIPVAEKIDHPALSGWTEKEGVIFVQPPIELLQQLVALRLHIDDCAVSDGPLKVVPGSHLHGRVSQTLAQSLRSNNGEVICPVARGGVMIMRPLLLHASSKATGQSRRRVLHFLFAPKTLPFGLRWHHAL